MKMWLLAFWYSIISITSSGQNFEWGLSLLGGFPLENYALGARDNVSLRNPQFGLGLECDFMYTFNGGWQVGAMLMLNSLGMTTGESTGISVGAISVNRSTRTYPADYSISFFNIGPFVQYFIGNTTWKPYARIFGGYASTFSSMKLDYSSISDNYSAGTVGEIRYKQPGPEIASGIGVQRAVNNRNLKLDILLQFHFCFNSVNGESYSIHFHDARETEDIPEMTISNTHFLTLHIGFVF